MYYGEVRASDPCHWRGLVGVWRQRLIRSLMTRRCVVCSQDLPVKYVYTYGQPRVGNRAFQHFYVNGTSNNRVRFTCPSSMPILPLSTCMLPTVEETLNS